MRVADPGEGPRGPAPLPLLLDQTEALETAPQYLSVWMTDQPPPPRPPPLSEGLEPALLY